MSTVLSKAEMERAKIGWCNCGRSGRQHHSRISAVGQPEMYVRSRWKCFAITPVVHERVDLVSHKIRLADDRM